MNKKIKKMLSVEQVNAIALLASGCTVRYTALVLGVKPSAVSRWMTRDSVFINRLAASKNACLVHKMNELSAESDVAV
jgi:hypothetical protein